jgi:hypothetical protein
MQKLTAGDGHPVLMPSTAAGNADALSAQARPLLGAAA